MRWTKSRKFSAKNLDHIVFVLEKAANLFKIIPIPIRTADMRIKREKSV